MCLFPRFIKNPKYNSYKLKKGDVICDDFRKMYVPIGCGKCYECKRQKAQQWRIRLAEELKVHKHAYFCTLTFAPEELKKLAKENECIEDSNAIATIALRRFLERYRKQNKHSIKHWFITELGHEETERIHMHGIIFDEEEWDNEKLFKFWKYGKCDTGQYVNLRTINYVIKYMLKIDTKHKNFEPVVLCSAGLGENYVHTWSAKNKYKYIKGNTPEYYTLPNGAKVALPIYYRNKFYTEKERENMWTDRLDKAEIYVNGIKIQNVDTEKGQKTYYTTLATMQEWNNKIGYGNTSEEWKTLPYNITFKMLQKGKRGSDAAKRST